MGDAREGSCGLSAHLGLFAISETLSTAFIGIHASLDGVALVSHFANAALFVAGQLGVGSTCERLANTRTLSACVNLGSWKVGTNGFALPFALTLDVAWKLGQLGGQDSEGRINIVSDRIANVGVGWTLSANRAKHGQEQEDRRGDHVDENSCTREFCLRNTRTALRQHHTG
jgi:hypothetical protein